jgi:putative DNA-invertase from lambdoid prophage Rac
MTPPILLLPLDGTNHLPRIAIMRTFAYSRVSTEEQTTENQRLVIEKDGHVITEGRFISEVVSGGVHAMQRTAFKSLVEHKLEAGDTLVVAKLDRLGRDNVDVQNTITMLMDSGVKVVSLDLPVSDLTSAEGRLMLQVFSAFAEFEKARISERTIEGQARARAEGKTIGRPVAVSTTTNVQAAKAEGLSQSKVAAKLDVSVATVKRHWNK